MIDKLSFSGKKELKVIHQNEMSECGLACLAMIGNYHGHEVDMNYLRRKFSISSKGANLDLIIKVSEKLHFNSRPLKLELEEINQLELPCIIHWDMNHFVVLKAVKGKYVELHDPAMGYRKILISEFSNHFTGIALELSPKSDFKEISDIKKPKLSMFWSKISGLKSSLIQIFCLSILMQVIAIATPYYSQILIDDVVPSSDTEFLKLLALGFAGLAIFLGALTLLRSKVILYLSNQLNLQMGSNLFSHLIRLPMEYFEKRHIGDVVSRFSSLAKIKELITNSIIEALVDGIMSIGLLVMMFLYSPSLAMITVIAIGIYSGAKIGFFPKFKQLNEEWIVNEAKQNTNFIETIRAIQSIKLFGNESQREVLWQDKFADSINSSIKTSNVSLNLNVFNVILFGVEAVVVLFFAVMAIIENSFSVGMLFAYIAYKTQLTAKASNLIDKFIQFKMLSLHLERVGDIALTETEDYSDSMFETSGLKGGISVKDISYKYSDVESRVLNAVNFDINPGESVAIVGPSGCGKTTLIKLMLGLFKPEEGEILIDGVNIQKMGIRNYRGIVSSVMQDDKLFSGSLFDNISFFEPGADPKWVIECAQLAAIHEDIMSMPMGYDTLIGDMGSSLSGGQRQRVMLARALYKRPKILFLDEATSHLDGNVESKVNESISKLDITRVIIAHRKETINSSDRIIRL